ncbi:hypothetical protein B0T24DRAFT_24932 [Lasiosphaeria ovina]|uniref:Uncharacterized protein n=1 Tax=Lasiosphaeria ovina TaxID=92902 RepID=A0AAE0NJU6_9PEZI|nr:hypothetical protein B0T24DRAFT_24932 [Lasiosphaeria ovina]
MCVRGVWGASRLCLMKVAFSCGDPKGAIRSQPIMPISPSQQSGKGVRAFESRNMLPGPWLERSFFLLLGGVLLAQYVYYVNSALSAGWPATSHVRDPNPRWMHCGTVQPVCLASHLDNARHATCPMSHACQPAWLDDEEAKPARHVIPLWGGDWGRGIGVVQGGV